MIALRLLLTASLVLAAMFGLDWVWNSYFSSPWTRDAFIRAEVVPVASAVAGRVLELHVEADSQVAEGELLLSIDPDPFERTLALRQAELRRAEIEGDEAGAEEARAAVRLAEQRLKATRILAPRSGYVTGLSVFAGGFAPADEILMRIVDDKSFHVIAYFLETKLPRIAVGAPARIQLMASDEVLRGRVTGVARAIVGSGTAEDVQQTFQWIRLAQRVPVRLSLEGEGPQRTPLVSGLTASVIVEPSEGQEPLSAPERLREGWNAFLDAIR